MSRILEALRRAEQDRQRLNGDTPAKGLPLPEMLRATTATVPPPAFTALPYREDPRHLRVAAASTLAGKAGVNGAEHFRLLRYRLETWRRTHTLQSLLITSAIPGEGKTLVATNLAETLAQGAGRVLLIDADLRRPGVGRALGLEPVEGLSELLQHGGDWRAHCREIDPLGFYYLAAGSAPEQPALLLQHERLKRLLSEAGEVFDWILIDSPPLVPFADSHYLAEASHGILLVARERVTPTADLQRALAALAGMPLIGIVFNAIRERRREEYYYAYYHSDGKRKRRAAAAHDAPASGPAPVADANETESAHER